MWSPCDCNETRPRGGKWEAWTTSDSSDTSWSWSRIAGTLSGVTTNEEGEKEEDNEEFKEVEAPKIEFGVEDLRMETVGVVVVVLDVIALVRGVAVGMEDVELRIIDLVFELGVREGVDVEIVWEVRIRLIEEEVCSE
jgi:hypothetical protein